MRKPNPEYIEALRGLVNASPYFSHLSMKMVDIGVGTSLFEMDVGRKHLQPFGFIHGGVFASILDSAAFWAMHLDMDDPKASLTSVDLKLNYLAPLAEGKLIARGRRIKLGKTLGYAEADVGDQKGKLLCHGTSTLMILRERGLSGDPSLPRKFLG